MHTPTINPQTLRFLKQLSTHNDRAWFNSHKGQYLTAKENVTTFLDALIQRMNQHDRIETLSGDKALYRIYNDVRFSKDKTPYSPRFAGHLKRAKPLLRGGYYFWIRPGSSRVGCGFTYPNSEDLKRVRQDIALNLTRWEKLLNQKSIHNNFGQMIGEQVRSAPRGYSKDHPAIQLLRYKQYWFEYGFTDQEVSSKEFLKEVNQVFKSIRPFFDHMSEVLTTDLNGEPLV